MSVKSQFKQASAALETAFYKDVNEKKIEGLVLYERANERPALSSYLTVKQSTKGNLYFVDKRGKMVKTPSDLYDKLNTGVEFEEGDVYNATLYWKKPIVGISDEELASKYANNAVAIANYKSAVLNSEWSLFVEMLHD